MDNFDREIFILDNLASSLGCAYTLILSGILLLKSIKVTYRSNLRLVDTLSPKFRFWPGNVMSEIWHHWTRKKSPKYHSEQI